MGEDQPTELPEPEDGYGSDCLHCDSGKSPANIRLDIQGVNMDYSCWQGAGGSKKFISPSTIDGTVIVPKYGSGCSWRKYNVWETKYQLYTDLNCTITGGVPVFTAYTGIIVNRLADSIEIYISDDMFAAAWFEGAGSIISGCMFAVVDNTLEAAYDAAGSGGKILISPF